MWKNYITNSCKEWDVSNEKRAPGFFRGFVGDEILPKLPKNVTTQPFFLKFLLLRLRKAGSKVLGKICWTISGSPSSNKVAFSEFFSCQKPKKKRGQRCLALCQGGFKNLPNRESESKQYWDFTLVFVRVLGSDPWHSVLHLTPLEVSPIKQTVNFHHSESIKIIFHSPETSWGFQEVEGLSRLNLFFYKSIAQVYPPTIGQNTSCMATRKVLLPKRKVPMGKW